MIGESGSGKTTSIKSARLSSPFAEVSRTSGISGTRNCDWWFFEQAIIIDTAGRHAIPVDEWPRQGGMAKIPLPADKVSKESEPLNGLIITVAADKLLSAPPETLEADGRSIRQRIDELMRVLGPKFPVYVLVTKCDLIQGMTQFCERLPEKALDRAMGFLNHDFSADIASFNERAMHTLSERLKDITASASAPARLREARAGASVIPGRVRETQIRSFRFYPGRFPGKRPIRKHRF